VASWSQRRSGSRRSLALAAALLFGAAGCASTEPSSLQSVSAPESSAIAAASATATATATATAKPTQKATAEPAAVACRTTDQDRYVYHPARLAVLRACLRVSCTVAFIRHEADGDLHIGLALDAPYARFVVAANQGAERGDLVIEPVCELAVTQADAIATCAAARDPLRGMSSLGEHVWMEAGWPLR
jgi:hypothetical protein